MDSMIKASNVDVDIIKTDVIFDYIETCTPMERKFFYLLVESKLKTPELIEQFNNIIYKLRLPKTFITNNKMAFQSAYIDYVLQKS